MRTEFEMSETQFTTLKAAMKPTPVIMIGERSMGASAQENADLAWQILGQEMGFRGMTARPVSGKGQRFFTAEVEEK